MTRKRIALLTDFPTAMLGVGMLPRTILGVTVLRLGLLTLCCEGCAAALMPPDSPDAEVAELATQSAGRPAIAVGEALRAQVFVLGVEAADTTVVACPGETPDRVRLRLKATSSGLAAMLKDVRMELETVVIQSTGLPLLDWSEVAMDGKLRHYDVWFSKGGYDYHYERSNGAPRDERIESPDGTWVHDLLSAAIWMRSWHPEPRARAHFYAVMGRFIWSTDITFAGTEVIVRADGPEPALRYNGRARKLRLAPNEPAERTFSIWFSDDPDHIPLRAVSDSTFGEVRLETSDYQRHSASPLCSEPSKKAAIPAP